MAKIFDYSTGINIDARQTTYRAVSQSGTARTEKASPLFYYLSSAVRQMYKDEYREVMEELAATDYGVNTFTTTLPHGLTWAEDDWSTCTVASNTTAGNSVSISPTALTGAVRAMDWIQFSGHSKVYQIKSDVTWTSANDFLITLNTPLVQGLTAGESITYGSNVQFKLLYQDIPGVQTIPGRNGEPLYTYANEFVLREVL